jgi:hypothetical protein
MQFENSKSSVGIRLTDLFETILCDIEAGKALVHRVEDRRV